MYISAKPVPASAGVGLRHGHFDDVLQSAEPLSWLEVHTENFLGGGMVLRYLEQVAERWPVSFHGVGLSLGSAGAPDETHLQKISRLFSRIEPAMVSEHLSWSVSDGAYLNDLLPLPYTKESLRIFVENVQRVQDVFNRKILIENPSRYLACQADEFSEPQFLNALVRQSGCGLLLDLNNVFVSAANLKFSVSDYLAEIDFAAVGELHLAGHSVRETSAGPVLIDDHASAVCEAVWALYRQCAADLPEVPLLIERDANLPPLRALLAEARKADTIRERCCARVA
ncbi:DUF692 domain-containing protein [Granulosicoccaceae sp. 1_MG-2023]|nr:DUF692 domain-containing protein [Granulosicoccaceae sp. 1_MG-2023]